MHWLLAAACSITAQACRTSPAFGTRSLEVRTEPAVLDIGIIAIPKLEIETREDVRTGGRFAVVIFDDRNNDGRRDDSEEALWQHSASVEEPPLRFRARRIVLPWSRIERPGHLCAELVWQPADDGDAERMAWPLFRDRS